MSSKRRAKKAMYKTILKKRYTGEDDCYCLRPFFLPSRIHMAHLGKPRIFLSILCFVALLSIYIFIPTGHAVQTPEASFYDNIEPAYEAVKGSVAVNIGPESEVANDTSLPEEDVAKVDILPELNQETLALRKGEGLQALFSRSTVDFAEGESLKILKAVSKATDLRKMKAGTEIVFTSADRLFEEVAINLSQTTQVIVSRAEDGSFKAEKIELAIVSRPAVIEGRIDGSFAQTADKARMPKRVQNQFIAAFEGTVNFRRDINEKTEFKVVYEEKSIENGETLDGGNLLYASMTVDEKTIHRYYFTDTTGHTDYYDEDGKAAKRFLSVRPVAYSRISSGYGTRFHPVLKKRIMHWGTDMAAPHGTPVYAAGDGRIMVKGYEGDYGHYVQIRHNDQYSTAYAHMSRYAKDIAPGQYIRKGQIIGYVGSTGRSTGPHLHFEVIKSGKRVNPMRQTAVLEKALTKKDKERFEKFCEKVEEKYQTAKAETGKIMASKASVSGEL